MSEELRPCPFCGEMPVTENNLVACANKSCPTYDNYWTDPQILTIEQWNTRPLEDALSKRIAELEQDMSNKETEYTDLWDDALALQSRIAELEESDKHWAGNVKVCMQLIERYESNIAELEAENDQLTAHDAIERQDDKSPNDTQSSTIVYGKWIPVSERLPEEGHRVLVLLTDGAISIDLIYGNDFLYENWVGDITHWMPLPTPPEVQA